MGLRHYLDKEANCIVAEFTGAFPVDDAGLDAFYGHVAELFAAYGTNKLVADYRKMDYRQEPVQMVRSYKWVEKYNLNNAGYEVAIVVDRNSESFKRYRLFLAEWDTKRFFGDVKVDYSLFDSLKSAIGWMKGQG